MEAKSWRRGAGNCQRRWQVARAAGIFMNFTFAIG
ncbi:hypothetical protein L288_14580 [Sphingobium quisquiliarum P25]|uniref:Uncharacterized protein n=1 Tax=Sphingobium quisquiliarum P25 TaxID=1329909 RepID=T0GT65_9SPHN|nr:hypothetical protein L288_14580 [Sphingobium quisquiliarum P25]